MPNQTYHNSNAVEVDVGTGNVFEDLGFADAAEMTAKSKLAIVIIRTIRERELTQKQAAELTKLRQPDISNIMRGKLDGISIDRLFQVLNRLGHQIEVRVDERETSDARTLVLA